MSTMPMQILYNQDLMKKKTELILILILLLFPLLSCRREELSIRDYEISSFKGETGESFLSVYLLADLPDIQRTKMTITDPSKDLVWSFEPEKKQIDGIYYIGSDRIAMPKGFKMPSGEWTVELIYKDGRTVSRVFKVKSDTSSDQLE